MNSILSFIKILDVELEEIAHDIVEHKERSCFLKRSLVAMVEKVEDGG